jgi:hypothetical protein
MNFWWKLGATLGFLLLYGGGVWHVHSWYDGYHNEQSEMRAEARGEKIAGGFEADMRRFRQLQLTIHAEELHDRLDPKITDCALPADTRRMLTSAFAIGFAAR